MPRVVPSYKEEAKNRIINAAAQIFAEKGYHQSTMDDVAKKIGVSKGAIYQYFRNKEELFEEISKAGANAFQEILNSMLTGDDFLKIAALYFDKEMEQPAEGRILWLESLAETPRNKIIRKVLEESYSRYLGILVNFLNRTKTEGNSNHAIDSRSLARVLLSLHEGVLVDLAEGLDISAARKVWTDGVDFIFRGIRASN